MLFKPAMVKQTSTSVDSSQFWREIIWVLKCVAGGYSNNSCCDLQKIFNAMFTDSYIAKSITVGVDKMRYVVDFGIAHGWT